MPGILIVAAFMLLIIAAPRSDPGYAKLRPMKVGMDIVITPVQQAVADAIASIASALPKSKAIADAVTPAQPATVDKVPADQIDNMSIKHAPTVSAEQIDAILATYNSPAVGLGHVFYDEGVKRNIDPAYAVAFFIHESTAGTAGAAVETKNMGNIICAGYPTCVDRFRSYSTWDEGIADWYRLIDDEYVTGRGMTTIDEVIPVYAPSFENDVDGYKNAISATVAGWRRANSSQTIASVNTTILENMPAPTARYSDWNCAYWNWRGDGSDCSHYGTDYPAPAGTAVRVPRDCVFVNEANTTQYGGGMFQCTFTGTTDVLYLGHIKNIKPYARGTVIPAGTRIADVWENPNGDHVHVQITVNNKVVDWEKYQ
jgi:hypothetical protein